MTPCPKCQKPVDPLRARAVGVREAKIVAYCSAACAAADGAVDGVPVELVAKRSRTPSKLLEGSMSSSTKLSRRRRDSLDAKTAWDWIDDEPADLSSGIVVAAERRPIVTVLILVAIVVVLAGYVAYRM